MVKTGIIVGVSALALGAVVVGTSFLGYARTAGNGIKDVIVDSIPIEFQLDRARDMLKNDLEPEIRAMKHTVAESQIKLERLQAKLKAKQGVVTQSRLEIMVRRDELNSDKTTFLVSHGGTDHSYTKAQLENDLKKRLERFKLLDSTFNTEMKVLAVRTAAVEANENKVAKLLAAKEDLKLQIEDLEARVMHLKATETVNDSEFDESKMSDIQDLLDSLDAKVDVRERELEIEGIETDLIPVETGESSNDILSEVDAYFGNEAPFEDTASN